MDFDARLKKFLDGNGHCALITGNWGVGKSYAVRKWLKKQDDSLIKFEVSLFGKKDANELYSDTLCQLSASNRLKNALRNCPHDFSVSVGEFSFGLPIIGLLSSFLELKMPRLDPKNKVLLVIDDIERSDVNVTIPQILGYVEMLNKAGIKTILIANDQQLGKERAEKLTGFKEKVVSVEIHLDEPLPGVREEVLGKDLLEKLRPFVDFTASNNLRTLVKLREIDSEADGRINPAVLGCVYLCLLNLRENRLGKGEFAEHFRQDRQRLYKLTSGKASPEEIEKEIQEALSKLSSPVDFLEETSLEKGLIKSVEKGDFARIIREVFPLVRNGDYEAIAKIQPPVAKNKPRKPDFSELEVFFSSDPTAEWERQMDFLYQIADDPSYAIEDTIAHFVRNGTALKAYREDFLQLFEGRLAPMKEKSIPVLAKRFSVLGPSFIHNGFSLVPFSRKGAKEYLKQFFDPALDQWCSHLSKRLMQEMSQGTIDFYKTKESIKYLSYFDGSPVPIREKIDLDTVFFCGISRVVPLLSGEVKPEDWNFAHGLFGMMKDCGFQIDQEEGAAPTKTASAIEEAVAKGDLAAKRLAFLKEQYH